MNNTRVITEYLLQEDENTEFKMITAANQNIIICDVLISWYLVPLPSLNLLL